MTPPPTAICEDAHRSRLGERLRTETREAHAAAEIAFDLPARLSSVDSYADGLALMESVHQACAPALAMVADQLPPDLRAGPRHRRERLRADLERLGRAPRSAGGPPQPSPDPDAGLGAWYVLEGAALGGLVIAAEVRRRLPAALPATTYFAGEGRATAARWRVFQGALFGWETRGEAAADRVVDGAAATFATLIAQLGGVR